MKAVVIGGSGQIGGWLLRQLAARGHAAVGTYATVGFPNLVRLDAADHERAAQWVKSQEPDALFYPAGFTWVDGCERDPDRAFAANLDQPMNLFRACEEIGARFVYFSTDYVFDGRSGPNSEIDQPNPLSAYGRSKLAAEQQLGQGSLIIRTSWVYGPERQGKNFAYQLVRTLSQHRSLVCPSDQYSTPSYGPDVALAAIRLVEDECTGLIHAAGPETMARSEFARRLAVGFGLRPELIHEAATAELGQGAPRPLQGGLATARLGTDYPGLMRTVAESTADFLSRLEEKDDVADPRLIDRLP